MDLERIARTAKRTAKALKQENMILLDGKRSPIVHDGEASEMGEWKGFGIFKEKFDKVRKARAEKREGYDLWADLSSFKADIMFGQLLEMSPIARKTLKEGMSVTRRTRKASTRVVTIV